MTWPQFPFGTVLGGTLPTQQIFANNASISTSDYIGTLTVTSARRQVVRPDIVPVNSFKWENPGCRIARFKTNSAVVQTQMVYTNNEIRRDTYNGYGLLLVNGSLYQTFNAPQGSYQQEIALNVTTDFGSTALRQLEYVCPYGTSMEFATSYIIPGSTFTAADARPVRKVLFVGDSIVHGFTVTTAQYVWNYITANDVGFQLVNAGYGSAKVSDFLGSHISAGISPTDIWVNPGYNDFNAQIPLVSFEAQYLSWLQELRVDSPSAKIWLQTLTYTQDTNTITPADYRTSQGNAFSAWADGNSQLVDGLTMFPNNSGQFNGDPHPNNTGATNYAASATALL